MTLTNTYVYNIHIKFEISICNRSEDRGSQNFKRGHITQPRPLTGKLFIRRQRA